MSKVFLDLEQAVESALSTKSLLAVSRFRGVWHDSSALDNVIVLEHQRCAVPRDKQLYRIFDIWVWTEMFVLRYLISFMQQ